MSSISGNHNFNSIVNSVIDLAVSVKQFTKVNSREFINFLGRNVKWLKNEHPKASKAALIAGTVFVVGSVVFVVYKKCCAKKAANEAKTKAKQAAEAKEAEEHVQEMAKLGNHHLKQVHISLAEIDTKILHQEPITAAKKTMYIVYKNAQIAANKLPFIEFKSDEYKKEDAIAHFTSKQFLDSDGKGIAYDGTVVSIYLNLYFEFHDEDKKLKILELKKSELLKTKAQLSMSINSLKK